MNQHSERERIREAYLLMAKAGCRPGAPSDGFGNISLNRAQLLDHARLEREADFYADSFRREENECRFWIGCADSKRTRTLVYAVEAARLLCGGILPGPLSTGSCAARLIKLALAEIEAEVELREHLGRTKAENPLRRKGAA
jgi:hypothetical protein